MRARFGEGSWSRSASKDRPNNPAHSPEHPEHSCNTLDAPTCEKILRTVASGTESLKINTAEVDRHVGRGASLRRQSGLSRYVKRRLVTKKRRETRDRVSSRHSNFANLRKRGFGLKGLLFQLTPLNWGQESTEGQAREVALHAVELSDAPFRKSSQIGASGRSTLQAWVDMPPHNGAERP